MTATKDVKDDRMKTKQFEKGLRYLCTGRRLCGNGAAGESQM
jgi:hypothetical protein